MRIWDDLPQNLVDIKAALDDHRYGEFARDMLAVHDLAITLDWEWYVEDTWLYIVPESEPWCKSYAAGDDRNMIIAGVIFRDYYAKDILQALMNTQRVSPKRLVVYLAKYKPIVSRKLSTAKWRFNA